MKDLEIARAQIDPRHTALMVVDVENGFTHPDATLAKAGLDVASARAAVPQMNELIRAARAARVHIVYLESVYRREMNLPNNYAFWGPWETMPIHDSSWETEFCPDLEQPRSGDMIVKKYNYDAFSDTPLNLHLRARDIKTCVLIGVETCTCVETTARHAFILGYNIILASDCCAACGSSVEESRELHEAALRILGLRFGTILTGKEIADAWEAVPAEVGARRRA